MTCILALLALALAPPAPAQPAPSPVRGIVKSTATGAALDGVRVEVEVSGRVRVVPDATGADGRFAFDPRGLYPAPERQGKSLYLRFLRDGFVPVNRLLPYDWRAEGRAQELTIDMLPTTGTVALSAEEQAQLAALRSASGKTLYLFPYAVTAGAQVPGLEALNREFRAALHRAINAHLQSLGDAAPADISLQALPLPVDGTNLERVDAYGRQLNALGVVSGTVRPGPDATAPVRVTSLYQVIPRFEGMRGSSIYVDDELPAGGRDLIGAYKSLKKLWADLTVLAVGARELEQARVRKDRDGLRRIRDYVQAQLAVMGPGNEMLGPMKALKQEADRALAEVSP